MLSRPSAFVLKGVLTLILVGTALATSPRMAPQQNPQVSATIAAARSGRGGDGVSSGMLSQPHSPLFWEGRVGPEDAPRGGEPVECAAVPCDRFRLKIDLPFGTFLNPNRPGGVQVALRWFGNPGGHTLPPGVPGCCGEFDTLNLWVYKDGVLIASSPGIIAER